MNPPPHPDDLGGVVERHIHRVLAEAGGNLTEAARRLGIYRSTLQRKLRKYTWWPR